MVAMGYSQHILIQWVKRNILIQELKKNKMWNIISEIIYSSSESLQDTHF